MKNRRNLVACLLIVVFTANSLLVGAAHTHCPFHASQSHHDHVHSYTCHHHHSTTEDHAHDDSQDRDPAPWQHDEDDCAACRYLSQPCVPVALPADGVALEPLADTTPTVLIVTGARRLLSHPARAPPPADSVSPDSVSPDSVSR